MFWCQVNPKVVNYTLQFLNDKVIDEELPSVIPITRQFTRIVSHYTIHEAPTECE